MNLFDPWENITIQKLNHNQVVQYFDSQILIAYVLMGEITVVEDGEATNLKGDDFYIFSTSNQYDILFHSGISFLFRFEYGIASGQVSNTYVFSGNSVREAKHISQEVSVALRRLLRLHLRNEASDSTSVYAVYFTLLDIMEKHYRSEVRFPVARQLKHKIEEIKFYIDHHFEKEITLANLAKQLFISEQYLSRLFKERIGMGISEYIVRKRLERVRKQLLMSEESITDIVFASGFTNINSFNRLFKKYQGMTPSEFRSESKKNLIVKSNPQTKPKEELTQIKAYLEESMRASSSKELRISVKSGRRFSCPNTLINLGYAGDILHRSLMKEAQIMMQYTGFTHGRIWGIISDDIMVKSGGTFDFTKVDEILQTILDLKLKPFLELGFKGKMIHGNQANIIRQENFRVKSQDFGELLDRYRAFILHIVETYGYDEVAEWNIELYMPNRVIVKETEQEYLVILYDGTKVIDLTTNAGFFTYFTAIKKIIRRIHSELPVGGCGMCIGVGEHKIRSLLEEWSMQEELPDFVSMGSFPIDDIRLELENSKDRTIITSDPDYLLNAIRRIKDWIRKMGEDVRFYITEFNITISGRNIINDTAFKGPYILKNVLPMLEYCDIVGYWLLSDFSSITQDVLKNEIFGGMGILSKNGIPKPAFFAFDFLNSLGDRLLYSGDGILITARKNKLILLFYQYCHLSRNFLRDSGQKFNKYNVAEMFENDGKRHIQVILEDIATNAPLPMKVRRMGVSNGAFIDEANNLSSDDDFSKEEIEYLKHRCIPRLNMEWMEVKDSCLKLQVELHPHDMLLIKLG